MLKRVQGILDLAQAAVVSWCFWKRPCGDLAGPSWAMEVWYPDIVKMQETQAGLKNPKVSYSLIMCHLRIQWYLWRVPKPCNDGALTVSQKNRLKWSVQKEAPTYLKPAESLTTYLGIQGPFANLHLQAVQTTWIALIHKTQGWHHAYTSSAGVGRACDAARNEKDRKSPWWSNQSGAFFHPKVRCFQIAASRFLSAKDWCGVDWHPTSNRSHHHFHAEDCVCCGEFMIKTEWVRTVGNICALWEWHVSYGHGYRSRLGTPIVRSGWWFGTFFIFPFHIWDVILPIDFHSMIFQDGNIAPPSSSNQ